MLAKTYQGQNKLEEAERLNLRALRIRESTSGVDHPHIAILTNSLVEIYHIQGRYHEAVPLIAGRSLYMNKPLALSIPT